MYAISAAWKGIDYMNIKHAKIILALLIAALTLALCGCSGGDIQPPAETDAPRQPVRIEVSDTKAIARVLDKMGVEYSIVSDTASYALWRGRFR